MTRHKVPGGGNNDRTAARMVRGDDDDAGSTWERCEFEDVEPGDVIVIFEKDGFTPVLCTDGCLTSYVLAKPKKDDEGIWKMTTCSCLELANIKIPA